MNKRSGSTQALNSQVVAQHPSYPVATFSWILSTQNHSRSFSTPVQPQSLDFVFMDTEEGFVFAEHSIPVDGFKLLLVILPPPPTGYPAIRNIDRVGLLAVLQRDISG